MSPSFRLATYADLGVLLTLMPEFYALEHLRFDEAFATRGLQQILADRDAGAAYLIDIDAAPNGYFVLGFNFSLEFGGRYVWIDELYVRQQFRGRGVGRAALDFVESLGRRARMSAVRLEVARQNAGAERLYRRVGYEDYNRDLLTRWIR